MEQQMITLNMKMAAQGRQFLRMRIVHVTGLVVEGSLSSMERVKHATTGDSGVQQGGWKVSTKIWSRLTCKNFLPPSDWGVDLAVVARSV